MTAASSEFAAALDDLKTRGLYRRRRVVESPQGVDLTVDGRRLINFCSNDYLGLANHPDAVRAFKAAADRYGVGSGAAHLVCGHGKPHHDLEADLADFTGRARALLFSTGYMANLGVIGALTRTGDSVFEDRLNHASLLDGGLLSGARFSRYPHADTEALAGKLAKARGRKLIVSDGVFSMDGDSAPVVGLAELAQRHSALLMIDDAHGIGVLGAKGGGVVEQAGLTSDQAPVLMGTLGKALGCFGAFVAGSEDLIETLIQKARTYIYTTALPPAVAAAARASLRIAVRETWRRDKLKNLIAYFRKNAEALGLSIMPSASAIQPLPIGDSRKTAVLSDLLLAEGLWVGAIRPPTVPQGTARLRITLSALHEREHVDRLLSALARINPNHG